MGENDGEGGGALINVEDTDKVRATLPGTASESDDVRLARASDRACSEATGESLFSGIPVAATIFAAAG